MGGGRWSPSDWDSFKTTKVSGKSTREVFTSKKTKDEFNPKNIKIRESRDSKDNPNSNAIIIAFDVTGSMHPVIDSMVRKGLPTLLEEIYNRKPVEDPHVMLMAVGDVNYDTSPLQATQFEADIRIAEQLKELWLEGGGGGNDSESYHFPWYLASTRTSIDCFEKRGKKGYLFTIGDESTPPALTTDQIKRFTRDIVQNNISAEELYEMVSRTYEVFHLIIEQGSNYRPDKTQKKWTKLLGQRAIPLSDHTKLSEVIVSTIQLLEGERKEDIIESWDGDTSLVVSKALDKLTAEKKTDSEVIRFD